MKKPNRMQELRHSRNGWRRHLSAVRVRHLENLRRHSEAWNKTPGAEGKRRRRRLGVPRIKGASR